MKIKHKDLANAVRFLSLDAVEAANSGHPGMPMGMADVATVLFKNFLRFNPKDPSWFNRDRFVLSAGHGSMLLYSLLYLTGYKSVSLDDIKNFRKLDSICAGHPEYHSNSGIENWFQEKILTAVFVFLSTMLLGITVVYIIYISAKMSGLIDKMKKIKDPRKTI